jgi:hypothetical protein
VSNIFEEVDEDVRRDQYIGLWRAYGKYGVAILLAIVLGTASGVGYHEYTESSRNSVSDQYESAVAFLKSGEEDEAVTVFAEMAEGTSGTYQVLAVLREAAVLSSNGDPEGAVAAYDRVVSGEVPAPQILSDLAALRAAMLLVDTAPREDVESRLAPLAGENGALRFSARELQGVVALRHGDAEVAYGILKAITQDGKAPPALRARAAALASASGGGT